jgi:hypothetical protein
MVPWSSWMLGVEVTSALLERILSVSFAFLYNKSMVSSYTLISVRFLYT